ncbi:hypothetical protein PMAYCL1PPCAC_07305, partial [Pristionchus mayeri]
LPEPRGRKRSECEWEADDGEDREPLNTEKRKPFLDTDFKNRPHEFIAFDSRFVKAMLGNVKMLLIGDSLMRGLYKDLITWTQTNNLSTDGDLKGKAESNYKGDRQIDISLLTDDKVFRQAREYQTESLLIQFLFTTRVMKDDMETLIQQMLGKDGYPDVILINSMIWDLTRYFKVSMDTAYSDSRYQKKIEIECLQKYLDRTSMLLRRLRAVLPPHTMVIWVCFPHCRPSMAKGRGMQMEPLTLERNHFIRSVMIDGSFRVSQVVRNAGYDVLDFGFYMRNHAFYHYQKLDGMHWLPPGVRLMSQLLMQFLAKSWGIDTRSYLSKLEENQDKEAMKIANKQMDNHGFFYTRDMLKLGDDIVKGTFEKSRNTDQYAIENIIQKGRAMVPFMQPPAKCYRQRKSNNVFGVPSSTYEEEVRLAPVIDRRTVHEVDDLGIELLAIVKPK